jgi:peroxiredoxin
MTTRRTILLIALVVLTAPALRGQATESSISKQLQGLGVAPEGPQVPGPTPDAPRPTVVPDAQRPQAILQLAKDIQSLPAGPAKVKFADSLFHAATDGEAGRDALQMAADTLAKALTELPQPPGKDGLPPQPYMDLAKLARYGGITTTLSDPLLTKAGEILAANEADIAKADFTLKDVNGKKVTLSALRGKIVLINFWSGTCTSCRKEMQDLDLIYTHFQAQGLVILSVISPTPENLFDLNRFLVARGFHPPVLLDDNGKVGKQFHIDGVPRTFVFDRDGKLVGVSIGLCTQRQFFAMLAKGGLHP